MPDREAASPQVHYREISLAEIVPSPKNRRYGADAEQGVLDMAETIRDVGVINPVSVRPLPGGGYEIVSGEGRWRAMLKAGYASALCRVRECDERTAQVERIIENHQRRPLTPMEEGEGIRVLLEECGNDHVEVAGKVKWSPSWVRRLSKLPDLVPAWREELARPGTPYTHIADSATKQLEIAVLPPGTQQALLDAGTFEHAHTLPEMRRKLAGWLMRLDAKPWSREWEKKNYSGSVKTRFKCRCEVCPSRSDRERTLFSDLESEMAGGGKAFCLDPDCWHAKEAAWCREQLRVHPGAIPLWDGGHYTPAAEAMVEREYGARLPASWSWEERGEANGRAFTVEAKGVFVGGARVGEVVDILLRDAAEDARDDALRHERVERRKEGKARAREEENRAREEYAAVRAGVEGAVPDGIGWLKPEHHGTFWRWCVWFGLCRYRMGYDAHIDGDWSSLEMAWAEDIRDAVVDAAMQVLVPGVWFGQANERMDPRDARLIANDLERLLGVTFAAIAADSIEREADNGDAPAD